MFNIVWNKLIQLLLPIPLRRIKIIDFIRSTYAGIIQIYNDFLSYRDYANYLLYFNGQTIYLEHLLNDQFDSILRRIYIYNIPPAIIIYIYLKLETKPKYIYQKIESIPISKQIFLKNNSEYTSNLDFIVKVPTGLSFNINLMKSWIERYKIAGKNYDIQYY